MRFVAGRVAAMAELLLARALWRSSIGKMLPLRGSQVAPSEELAAPREPVAPSGRCCRQWRSKDAIGKMLPSMAQLRCHREEQPIGEAAEKPEGRG